MARELIRNKERAAELPKMTLLKKWPPLFKPTSKGGVQVWELEVYQEGTVGVIITRNGKQGGKMTQNVDRVTEGKNIGRKNATSPITQAMADAQSEWDMKVTRKGYAENVADSKRFDGPMLAHKFVDVMEKIDYVGAIGQVKYDGFRCLARKEQGGKVTLTSRDFGDFDLPHLAEELAVVMQVGDVFDGELYKHGMKLQKIASLVKNQKPEDKHLSEELGMHLYDIGVNLPYPKRHELLRERLHGVKLKSLALVVNTVIKDEKSLIKFRDECIAKGYEGAMLRWGPQGYESGKRSYSLIKVKKFEDAEFEVIGAKTGRGKYAKVCVFRCKTPAGHEFDCTAPGSIPMKEWMWRHWESFVGCPLTVRFPNWTPTDKPVPFQPIAVRFRDSDETAVAYAEATAVEPLPKAKNEDESEE